ncbi:hypothetical protein DERF_002040 [Dermatophagoides farinae]|uniref:Uncharacterized protein n=1 Tax=Dermatophagoides farinae TaxID=6954 RepID=A0A922ICZ1_DERFA|nr:hypothetical protein DERF_002040 [Dermatophagoides farinae]
MEHQETIWSHMEKSEFPFNSFFVASTTTHLFCVDSKFEFCSLSSCHSDAWFLHSRLELILDHESTMMLMMIVAAATSLFVLYKV